MGWIRVDTAAKFTVVVTVAYCLGVAGLAMSRDTITDQTVATVVAGGMILTCGCILLTAYALAAHDIKASDRT